MKHLPQGVRTRLKGTPAGLALTIVFAELSTNRSSRV